jgi:hypothetical protein
MIDMEPWEGSKPPATSSGGEASCAHAIAAAITAHLPRRVVD